MITQDVHADLRGTTVLMRSSVPALLLESKEYHILACQQRPSIKGKRVAYRCVFFCRVLFCTRLHVLISIQTCQGGCADAGGPAGDHHRCQAQT